MNLKERMLKMAKQGLNKNKGGLRRKASKVINFHGTDCELVSRTYANGATRLELFDMEDGLPYAVCTINLPNEDLEENEVIIKDYSENKGMLDALVSAGVVSEPVRYVRTGYIEAPVCNLLYFD